MDFINLWDIFGIAVILGKDAKGNAPCGCGECNRKIELVIRHRHPVTSDWIVHFLVPAKRFLTTLASQDHFGILAEQPEPGYI